MRLQLLFYRWSEGVCNRRGGTFVSTRGYPRVSGTHARVVVPVGGAVAWVLLLVALARRGALQLTGEAGRRDPSSGVRGLAETVRALSTVHSPSGLLSRLARASPLAGRLLRGAARACGRLLLVAARRLCRQPVFGLLPRRSLARVFPAPQASQRLVPLGGGDPRRGLQPGAATAGRRVCPHPGA